MSHEITLKQVAARPMAAVKRRVRLETCRAEWQTASQEIAKFLKENKKVIPTSFHVFVFHPDPKGDGTEGDAYYGQLVEEKFSPKGKIVCVDTPAGEAAVVRHAGSFDGLAAAHMAAHQWMGQSGRSGAGPLWEVYGSWDVPPEQLETYVYYLLRAH